MKTSQIRRAPEKAPKRSRSEWLEEVTRWRASGEDAARYSTRHGNPFAGDLLNRLPSMPAAA